MAPRRSIAGANVDSSHPAGSSPTGPVTSVDTPTSASSSAPRTTSSTVGAGREVAEHVPSPRSRSGRGRRRRSAARSTSSLWAISSGAAEDVAGVGVLGDEPQGLPLAAAADEDARPRRADRRRAGTASPRAGSAALRRRRRRRSTSAGRSGGPPRVARTARPSAGTGTPSPRCSRSYQAAPIPSSARPPDSTSRVVTILASRPGWRYVTPVTRSRSRRRSRQAGHEPEGGVALEHRVLGRGHPVHLEVVVHERERPDAEGLGALREVGDARADAGRRARPVEAADVKVEVASRRSTPSGDRV